MLDSFTFIPILILYTFWHHPSIYLVLNMRSCWTLSTSVSVRSRLAKWPPSWRYRVCFHLIERVSIGDKYILSLRTIITVVIHATMMAFIPCIDIRPSEGTFFKRYVNYWNLSALFSSGFQKCIFMRIRF
jgi:hypothetical protein